jgi:hypothetical protein
MKTFIYKNIKTKQRAQATHATFDEDQLSTPATSISPNSRALWGSLTRNTGTDLPDTSEILTSPEKLCVFAGESPFLKVNSLTITVKCTFHAFNLFLEMDPMSHRTIVVDVAPLSSVSYMEWTTRLQFRTIIQVDSHPVFTVHDTQQVLASIDVATQESFSLVVAPFCPGPMDQQAPLTQVTFDQLCDIHHVIDGWNLADPILLVAAENAKNMDDVPRLSPGS